MKLIRICHRLFLSNSFTVSACAFLGLRDCAQSLGYSDCFAGLLQHGNRRMQLYAIDNSKSAWVLRKAPWDNVHMFSKVLTFKAVQADIVVRDFGLAVKCLYRNCAKN